MKSFPKRPATPLTKTKIKKLKPSESEYTRAELNLLEKLGQTHRKETKEALIAIRKRIPYRIPILSHTIRVEFESNFIEERDAFGLSHYSKNLIILQIPNESVTEEQVFHTFWHELMHFVFFFGGHTLPLKDNEPLVDIVGGILAQATSAAQYSPTDEDIEQELQKMLGEEK
jgi:hypothetical protein